MGNSLLPMIFSQPGTNKPFRNAELLKGKKFATADELKTAVEDFFDDKTVEFHTKSIHDLERRGKQVLKIIGMLLSIDMFTFLHSFVEIPMTNFVREFFSFATY